MSQLHRPALGRRSFLKAAGVAVATAATGLGVRHVLPANTPALLTANYTSLKVKRYHLAATDGWASMPVQTKAIPPFFPDPLAPDYTAGHGYYVMGFRDVTAYADFAGDQNKGEFPLNAEVMDQKNKAQIAAPILFARVGEDLRFHLTNLGLANRPDLLDSHTIHFHGFPNQVVYFDGVPDNSLAAPIGRTLIYRYIPEDPGTYMWHCHFEDVEHVHMGLTGINFILPSMKPTVLNTTYKPSVPFYDYDFDFDYASTKFNRQFAFLLTEADLHAHYDDAHLQINDFSTWSATFRLMNGRAWPDTILPNIDSKEGKQLDGPGVPNPFGATNPGTRMADTEVDRLRYNPISSLIQANSGEKVLIRISNLGYEEHSIVCPGLQFQIVGRDAKPLVAGRPDYLADLPSPGAAYAQGSRADITWTTDRVDLGPGESRDLLFTAPNVTTRTVYPLYDRNDAFVADATGATGDGFGGARTEVHIFPAGSLPPQPQGSVSDKTYATQPIWVPNQLFTDASGRM